MPNKKFEKEIEVKYIYSPSPDAEERLQKAFDILFNACLKDEKRQGRELK